MSEERQEFRTPVWLTGVLSVAMGTSVIFAVLLGDLEGFRYESIALWCIAVFFAIGTLDSRTTKVVLDIDTLEIISNFRRKVIPRSELVRVVSEKGTPIALERKAGGWVKLPGTVSGLHPNKIRAWLKRGT